MEVAGWAKACEGSVMDGIKVVMLVTAEQSQSDGGFARSSFEKEMIVK